MLEFLEYDGEFRSRLSNPMKATGAVAGLDETSLLVVRDKDGKVEQQDRKLEQQEATIAKQ